MRSFLSNRFERKYVLSESRARAIRQFIQPYVRPDENLRPHHTRGYPVHSLYLDSPDLMLYRSGKDGHKNRFKLRIRYYSDAPEAPIFCEIKRRVDQIIRKQRCKLRRQALEGILAGHPLAPEDTAAAGKAAKDLEDFLALRRDVASRPTLIVSYHREAWLDVATGDGRLTFDRDLSASRFDAAKGLVVDHPPVRGHEGKVILEMKYVNRLPAWMQGLVHTFGLNRQSVPKYGWSVESIGERRVARWARSTDRVQRIA